MIKFQMHTNNFPQYSKINFNDTPIKSKLYEITQEGLKENNSNFN